ncbi:hypothetical protein [Actinokineospora sp. NPDC004072]
MTTVMTDLDVESAVNSWHYHYTRVVDLGGRVLRARVRCDRRITDSHALAEVLTDQLTWTSLVTDAPDNWWYSAPVPRLVPDATEVLAPIAQRLLDRAARVLTALPPVPPATPPPVDPAR